MPVLKTKAGLPAYMEVINTLNKNAKFDTVAQARKAAKQGSLDKLKRGPERTVSIGSPTMHYEVVTNLPADLVNDLLVQTLDDWVQFAQGKQGIGGRTLEHPSGRYASSLSIRQRGSSYTIFSKSNHADILEAGHRAFSMAKYSSSYPVNPKTGMHVVMLGDEDSKRSPPPMARLRSAGGKGLNVNVVNNKAKVRKSFMSRYGEGPQFRTIDESSPGWKVPRMLAYSPAWHLAQKLKLRVKAIQKAVL